MKGSPRTRAAIKEAVALAHKADMGDVVERLEAIARQLRPVSETENQLN